MGTGQLSHFKARRKQCECKTEDIREKESKTKKE